MKRAGLPSLFSSKPFREIDRNDLAAKGIMRIKSAIKVSSMPVTVYIGDDGTIKTTKDKEVDQRRVIGMYSKAPSRDAFLSDLDATRESLGIWAHT